jgi:hypothetical protein
MRLVVENQLVKNQPLSAVLAQISETGVTHPLDTIAALQVDLIRLFPLFDSEEPVEAVVYVQGLLRILHDEISLILSNDQPQES